MADPKLISIDDEPQVVAVDDSPLLTQIDDAPAKAADLRKYFEIGKIALKTAYSMTPQAKAWKAAKTLENKSREGLQELTEMIPDAKTGSVAANIALNTPKTLAAITSEVAPSFIAPENVPLMGAGPLVKAIGKSKPVAAAAATVWSKVPEKVKELVVYKFGRPAEFIERLEKTEFAKSEWREKSIDVGKALSEKLGAGQQERAGQIVRGSETVSKQELGLRLRANYAREAIDALESQAKELGLMPETTLNKLSPAQRTELRQRVAIINTRIEKLREHGMAQKEKLLQKAHKLKVQGATGVVRSVERVEKDIEGLKDLIDTTKIRVAGNTFDGVEEILSSDAMRRNGAVQKLLTRFERSSIGDQEKMFVRLSAAANRAGVKVDDIFEQGLSIGGFQGLVKRIAASSSNFPGKRRMVNQLTSLREGIEKRIADSYRVAGQKYMPRMYIEKEIPLDESLTREMFGNRIRRDRFKARMDLPAEARVAMGEITKPAYPVAKGLVQVSNAVENAKLFNSVAENAVWSTADEAQAAARGWTKLPDSKALGALSGRYVQPYIAKDINQMITAKTDIERVYRKMLGAWKFGKVVANPATHFRNMFANSIMMDLGGLDLMEQPKWLHRAAKEYLSKGSAYQEAKAAKVFGGEFYGSEIKRFRDGLIAQGEPTALDRLGAAARGLAGKMGDTYQAEEQVYKMAKFLHNKSLGMGVKEAAADAEKWLFNYAKVPKAIDVMRNAPVFGAPFITYLSKALPRVVEAGLNNPMKLYKYQLLFNGIEKVSKERLGLSDEKMRMIKENARGTIVVLPSKDKNGDPMVLDLSYILPWGDVGETGGFAGLPPALVMGSPLKTIIELGVNKSIYRDSEIWKGSDPTHVKAAKISDYFLKAMLPTLTPGAGGDESFFRGGYSYEKLRAAGSGKPSFPFQDVREVPSTISDVVFGLKIKPANLDKAQTNAIFTAKKQQAEAAAALSWKMRHKGLDLKAKEEAVKDYKETVERITKGLQKSLGRKTD